MIGAGRRRLSTATAVAEAPKSRSNGQGSVQSCIAAAPSAATARPATSAGARWALGVTGVSCERVRLSDRDTVAVTGAGCQLRAAGKASARGRRFGRFESATLAAAGCAVAGRRPTRAPRPMIGTETPRRTTTVPGLSAEPLPVTSSVSAGATGVDGAEGTCAEGAGDRGSTSSLAGGVTGGSGASVAPGGADVSSDPSVAEPAVGEGAGAGAVAGCSTGVGLDAVGGTSPAGAGTGTGTSTTTDGDAAVGVGTNAVGGGTGTGSPG